MNEGQMEQFEKSERKQTQSGGAVRRGFMRKWTSLVDQMTLRDTDDEMNKRFKDLLKDLSAEEILELVHFNNPATFTNESLVKKGVTDPGPLELAKIAFVMKMQGKEMREKIISLFGNLNAVRTYLKVDEAEEKPSESELVGIDEPEGLKRLRQVDDHKIPCHMAMVLQLIERQGCLEVSKIKPFIVKNKDHLWQLHVDNFKNPDALLVFYSEGEWNIVGQKDDEFSASQEMLKGLWSEHYNKKGQQKLFH